MKNEERGEREAENEERETGNRERATATGERTTENGTQGTGTRNQGPNTGNGKMKMQKKKTYTKAQSANHHPFSVLLPFFNFLYPVLCFSNTRPL